MKKNNKNSVIDGLNFSTFNYFGLGSVLPCISQAFWINFSSYYLNNLIPQYGNTVFLVSQIVEGIGIILGWILLKKLCEENLALHMRIYMIGASLMLLFLPLIFIPPFCNPAAVMIFACLFKVGSGLMVISQLTIIPRITSNRNRRQRKLVQKITQFGLGGTFVAMLIMTAFSTYVSFVWKYFIGVVIFTALGSICSLVYFLKINHLLTAEVEEKIRRQQFTPSEKIIPDNQIPEEETSIISYQKLKTLQFYIYGLILCFCSLYIDIIMAMYPYFIKSFQHISQFRYLSAIVVLYLSSFLTSLLARNSFVYSEIRLMMAIGFATSTLAAVFFILGFVEVQFGVLIFVGTCLTGISKVIASNCALNIINEYIGKDSSKSKQFVYGTYYFLERVVTGLVLYGLISRIYTGRENQLLHFSWIYLPFILYTVSCILVVVDRSLKARRKNSRIQIVEGEAPHPAPLQTELVGE